MAGATQSTLFGVRRPRAALTLGDWLSGYTRFWSPGAPAGRRKSSKFWFADVPSPTQQDQRCLRPRKSFQQHNTSKMNVINLKIVGKPVLY